MATERACSCGSSCPEEMPIPVNPVENGDKQENCHLPLVAKAQNSFLTL